MNGQVSENQVDGTVRETPPRAGGFEDGGMEPVGDRKGNRCSPGAARRALLWQYLDFNPVRLILYVCPLEL